MAMLNENGLAPARRAHPRTLVRRRYFDLLGLPAPAEAVQSFSSNPSAERWERLVDTLLASNHYGECWARHWMDVARFGESGGFEYNTPHEAAWRYRDWLICSLNDDLPYDEFVRMQVAGDLLDPGSVDGMAAVGFLVAGVHNEVLGTSPRMHAVGRQDELEEIAGTVGQAFLGMTVHCACCHDHKFDPISIEEYYQFIAALDGVTHGTRRWDHGDDPGGGDPQVRDGAAEIFTVVARSPGVMRVHRRGDVGRLGDEVPAGGLRAVRGLPPSFGIPADASNATRRTKLAEWITSPDNPLFHRVAVNRVWHHHFGQGLVTLPNDFGFNGGLPSHPDLLDWLAVWFRDNGYSLKRLHRLILTSARWRMNWRSSIRCTRIRPTIPRPLSCRTQDLR